MQTITTKFHGPTNTRGARYSARCDARRLSVAMDYALSSEENHIRAARQLITELEWFHEENRGDRYGDWFFGGNKDGSYTFVCAVDYARVTPAAGKE